METHVAGSPWVFLASKLERWEGENRCEHDASTWAIGEKNSGVPQSDETYFKQSAIHIHPSIHRKDQTNNVNNSAHNNTIGALFGQ